MKRLVVVSNRVPPPSDQAAEAGGLAVALRAALRERGGLWLGWSGNTCEETDAGTQIHRRVDGNTEYVLVDLTRRDIDEYYYGFANRSLWPLLHYRLDLVDFDRQDLGGYRRVNALFAHALQAALRDDDVIWVHDYHLIPLAADLRARGILQKIGFFLHIPWPPPDVWLAMPAHRELLLALTAYDLIGFQTKWDAENFALCLKREGIGEQVAAGVFSIGDRRFRIGAYPIGIDTKEFAEMARKAPTTALVGRAVASLVDKDLIIGVDRLDYSKGLDHRMLSYERFLKKNPAYHGKVAFLQVTPKSRSEVPEYVRMQRQLASTAGRINGAYGQIDWTPIRYVNRSIKRSTLAGLYRLGRLGLVTPLRDGMNLVAKEYVAAQDETDPGVLVLSRFAGAAQDLTGAILVNPYDLEGTANAIAQGLSMPLEARIERWRPMFEALRRNTVTDWARAFLADLASTGSPMPLRAVG